MRKRKNKMHASKKKKPVGRNPIAALLFSPEIRAKGYVKPKKAPYSRKKKYDNRHIEGGPRVI